MLDKKEIKDIKKKIMNNYTKNELTEQAILFGIMIYYLIEDNKGRYTHDEYFKKYELKANNRTGLKFKSNLDI